MTSAESQQHHERNTTRSAQLPQRSHGFGGLRRLAVIICGLFWCFACVTPTQTEVKPWHRMGKTASDTSQAVPAVPVRPPAPPAAVKRPPPLVPVQVRQPVPAPRTTGSVPTPGAVGPRVSKSMGANGGFVVLWPRVIPSQGAEGKQVLAQSLQRRLSAVVNRAAGARPVDVRPAPERVCPQNGCVGTAVGVLLLHHSRGCAAVAMVTPPGPSQTRLTTIAGTLSLKAESIPFRDYPESQVTVRDFVPCEELMQQISNSESQLEMLIKATSGS